MKPIHYLILFFLIILAACNPSKKQDIKVADRPNVLFIAVDDLNDWLGCMEGHPNAKTPNMDKLASQGVLYTNAHCQAPLCGPSRASLMTGMRPSSTGIYGMINDNRIRSDNEFTKDVIFLPEYFKKHDYHTMGIGKLFHSHAPDDLFDESGGRYKGFGPLPEKRFVWDGIGTSDQERYGRTSTDWGAFPESDTLMTDHKSADWTIERLGRQYEQPFFLAVGFLRPHVPLYVPQKWFDMHPVETLTMPPYNPDDLNDVPPVALQINDLPMMPQTDWAIESGEWPNIVQAYLACVSFVDYEIGRIMEALEESRYADNTVIVLWSDHGYRLGEKGTFAKHALWEEATNAPLMFAGPGLPEGKVISSPAEMLSIYPTLLELCGLPSYDKNEGSSLVSVMQGKENTERYAITTFGMNNHAVRSDHFRFIQYEDGLQELYDHREDPFEWTNEASNNKYQITRELLADELPVKNEKWNMHSQYTFQPYFVEQKKRTSGEE
jgi:arylsulfatase A-like enzyme